MRWFLTIALLICSACQAPQPEYLQTVAAFEVELPTAADKTALLNMMRVEAKQFDMHVDAANDEELKILSEASPVSFSAAIWIGNDDDESVASAMDFADRIGQIWLTFSKGTNPQRNLKFQTALMQQIYARWPNTLTLPIMPTGAIPLKGDLIRTASGYVINPAAASKYESPAKVSGTR